MATAEATLKNYRQSPRKVRLVTDYVKGKHVARALAELDLLAKRGALPIKKLIESALANAKNLDLDLDTLIIKDLRVDGGAVLMRRMPRARGSAFPLKKRTSHVHVVLEGASKKPMVAEKAAKPASKKVPAEKTEKEAVVKKPRAKKVTK